MRVRTQVEFAASLLGDAIQAQFLILMLLPGGGEAGAVQLNARAALGKGAHGLKEAILIDGVDDVVLVFAAVDQPRGQVRDADFMEGDRQARDFLQTFQQQIGNLIGLRNAFGADKLTIWK